MLAKKRDAVGLDRGVGQTLACRFHREPGNFGEGGEAVFAVERGVNGAAHQARARKRGEHGRGEPANRDAAGIDRLVVMQIETERGLIAKIDRRGNTVRPRPRCLSPAFQTPSPYTSRPRAPWAPRGFAPSPTARGIVALTP